MNAPDPKSISRLREQAKHGETSRVQRGLVALDEAGIAGDDYKTADSGPLTAAELSYRFHATTASPVRWGYARQIVEWVELHWLKFPRFRIPTAARIDHRKIRSVGYESKEHLHAKASIAEWLERNVGPVHVEDDGVDVTCLDGSIWAECGNTYFNRFEMLMAGWHKIDFLMLVSKEPNENGMLDVMVFEPTVVGAINYASRQFFWQAEFDAQVQASWKGFPRPAGERGGPHA